MNNFIHFWNSFGRLKTGKWENWGQVNLKISKETSKILIFSKKNFKETIFS